MNNSEKQKNFLYCCPFDLVIVWPIGLSGGWHACPGLNLGPGHAFGPNGRATPARLNLHRLIDLYFMDHYKRI